MNYHIGLQKLFRVRQTKILYPYNHIIHWCTRIWWSSCLFILASLKWCPNPRRDTGRPSSSNWTTSASAPLPIMWVVLTVAARLMRFLAWEHPCWLSHSGQCRNCKDRSMIGQSVILLRWDKEVVDIELPINELKHQRLNQLWSWAGSGKNTNSHQGVRACPWILSNYLSVRPSVCLAPWDHFRVCIIHNLIIVQVSWIFCYFW